MIEILLVLAYIDSLVCSQRHLSLPFSTPLPLPSFHHVLMSTNGLCTKFSSGGYWARHNGDISSHDLKKCLPRMQTFSCPSASSTVSRRKPPLYIHVCWRWFTSRGQENTDCCNMTLLKIKSFKEKDATSLKNIQKGNNTLKKISNSYLKGWLIAISLF